MSNCARCGAALYCAQADGPAPSGAPCWCMALPAVLPVPAAASPSAGPAAAGCWCPACLQLALAGPPSADRPHS